MMMLNEEHASFDARRAMTVDLMLS